MELALTLVVIAAILLLGLLSPVAFVLFLVTREDGNETTGSTNDG